MKTSFIVKKDELKVVMERVFDAPRELVWKTITDPGSVPKWWGPAKFKTVVDKMDFRVGGQWRFLNVAGDGQEFAFNGVYKEIVPMEKVVDTFNFEPIGPGHEMTETMVLEVVDGNKSKATQTSVYQNLADLEGMVNSGMESGAVETWERLAELVEKK